MSIEAMKQALEALESGCRMEAGRLAWIEYDSSLVKQAITSLRQAIAEAEKQEPVMGVEVKRIASGGFIGNVWWIHENLQEGVFHLYTHPQPKREPLTNDNPLLVFAKECVLGAYSEDELANAAFKAIEAAHGIKE